MIPLSDAPSWSNLLRTNAIDENPVCWCGNASSNALYPLRTKAPLFQTL